MDDGYLTLPELVDLYGRSRFDVLCVTDHAVATGDVHRAEHLASWKTLLPCDREPAAVVAHLRSGARAFLTPFALQQRIRLPVAA